MRLKYVIARAPGPVAIPSFFRPVPMVHTASSTGSPRRCDHRLAMTCSFSGGISTPNCTRSTGICQRATGCIGEDIGEIRHYRPVGAIHESPADANGIGNNRRFTAAGERGSPLRFVKHSPGTRKGRPPRRPGAQRKIASPGEKLSEKRSQRTVFLTEEECGR